MVFFPILWGNVKRGLNKSSQTIFFEVSSEGILSSVNRYCHRRCSIAMFDGWRVSTYLDANQCNQLHPTVKMGLSSDWDSRYQLWVVLCWCVLRRVAGWVCWDYEIDS